MQANSQPKLTNLRGFAGQVRQRLPKIPAVMLAVLLVFGAMAPNANAGGRHGGYAGHGWSGSGGHHYRGHRGYRQGYRRGYRGYRGYRGHRRHNRDGAYLIGGLVVGSLLTHAYNQSRADRYDNGYYSRSRAAPRTVVSEPTVSRRLFRDANGNCFEREISNNGEELLIELPAKDCAW